MARVFQNQHGIRSQPLSDKLLGVLESVAQEAGVYFDVGSGGQPESGPKRTGSHRHDDGNSADTKAYTLNPDGSKHYLDISNDADKSKWAEIVKLSRAAGATGIGMAPDYMGNRTAHIGFGTPSVWGAGGHKANAPDWLVSAYDAGTHLPPRNIPQVGTALDTIDRAFPRQRPSGMAQAYAEPSRPPSVRGLVPGPFNVTPRLQPNNTLSHISQLTGMSGDARAASGASASDSGFGTLSDPRTSALLSPSRGPQFQPGMTGRGLPPPVPPSFQPGMMGRAPGPDGSLVSGDLLAAGVFPYSEAMTPTIDAPMPRPRPDIATAQTGAPPVPMSRPPDLPAQPVAPTPMQRPMPPAPPQQQAMAPQQPAAQQLRLASGKMIAPGTYTGKNGMTYTVSAGPNGNAVVQSNRAGFLNIGREMNAPTLVGSMIRAKIPEAIGGIPQNLGYAADNVKNAAVDAATNLGNNVGGLASNLGSGLMGLFGQHPSVPGPQFQPGMMGRGSMAPPPVPMQRPNFASAAAIADRQARDREERRQGTNETLRRLGFN